MLAKEAVQMNPNARAIVRNPLTIPKCEFYDAFRSAQSCFFPFKCLVNALTGELGTRIDLDCLTSELWVLNPAYTVPSKFSGYTNRL